VSSEHAQAAEEFKRILAVYQSSEDLINIGAYKKGANKEIDHALKMYPLIQQFLQQGIYESPSLEESYQLLTAEFGKDGV
jgi:flagellum-specific ATP synthase